MTSIIDDGTNLWLMDIRVGVEYLLCYNERKMWNSLIDFRFREWNMLIKEKYKIRGYDLYVLVRFESVRDFASPRFLTSVAKGYDKTRYLQMSFGLKHYILLIKLS